MGRTRPLPYLLLAALVLGTGLGIGLGLTEAPSGITAEPIPPRPSGLNGFWTGPSTQTTLGSALSARALATDIDRAPVVRPGTYHCPVAVGDIVVLRFQYPGGTPTTATVALTGCAWVRFGSPMKPSDDPGRGPNAARWVTAKLRADLIELGGPIWALRLLTPAPPKARTVPTGVERCSALQLALTVLGSGVAAGNVGTRIGVTNTSPTPCFLYGYPGMQMLDSVGDPIPTDVVDGTSSTVLREPVKVVVLRTRSSAQFDIGYSDSTGYGTAICPESSSVAIVAPGTLQGIILPLRIAPYGGSTIASLHCGQITVSPIYNGGSQP
jgi:hypothetical protein